MHSRKVLIFGATGEIGGRIVRDCVRAGHKVTGISRGRNRAPFGSVLYRGLFYIGVCPGVLNLAA